MRLGAREFCAACFVPIDGRRPGCNACRVRDQYRRRKETNPGLLTLLNRAKHVRSGITRGQSWATPELLERRLHEYREARAA